MEHQVTLQEMLEARERRAFRQQELLAAHRAPLISFTRAGAAPAAQTAGGRQNPRSPL